MHTHATHRTHGTGHRHTTRKPASRRGRTAAKKQVGTHLIQLTVCVGLFLCVYIGRGIFPAKIETMGTQILEIMGADTDFRGAFSRLGVTMMEKDSLIGDLGAFCVEVFGGEEQAPAVPVLGGITAEEHSFLTENPTQAELMTHYLRQDDIPQEWADMMLDKEVDTEVVAEEREPEEMQTLEPMELAPTPLSTVPAIGTVLEVVDSDVKLPRKTTLNHIYLGDIESITPVLGVVTSSYGQRDNPVGAGEDFHKGVDIRGKTGTPIQAYADGTVDYVGSSSSFGLYFRLDHGDGIKSFYSHCDEILVKKGEKVSMGEKVATVGATGKVTGSHLHFELTWNGTFVDPCYYIDYLED